MAERMPAGNEVGGAEFHAAVFEGPESEKDVVELLPLYADEAVMEDVASNRRFVGKPEVERAPKTMLAAPDLDVTVGTVASGDGWAAVSWTADGTQSGSGRLAQVEGVSILEIDGGLIVGERLYYDPARSPF